MRSRVRRTGSPAQAPAGRRRFGSHPEEMPPRTKSPQLWHQPSRTGAFEAPLDVKYWTSESYNQIDTPARIFATLVAILNRELSLHSRTASQLWTHSGTTSGKHASIGIEYAG